METWLLIFLLNSEPTYTKDVKPIFQKRCMQCHSSGPLNWMKYENSYKYRDRIKYRVWTTRTMPPGGFITEDERKTIRDWVDQGAKE